MKYKYNILNHNDFENLIQNEYKYKNIQNEFYNSK